MASASGPMHRRQHHVGQREAELEQRRQPGRHLTLVQQGDGDDQQRVVGQGRAELGRDQQVKATGHDMTPGGGAPREAADAGRAVTRVGDDAQAAHALQCAQLAEWAQAEDSLVAAALLHDIGHFESKRRPPRRTCSTTCTRCAPCRSWRRRSGRRWSSRCACTCRPSATWCATSTAGYHESLSPASCTRCTLQGGPMGDDECRAVRGPALCARRGRGAAALGRPGQEAAGKKTPPLDYYLPLLRDLVFGVQTARRAPARLLAA
jgi:predicted HD phosphohydrolase